jgi:hypothetical protein
MLCKACFLWDIILFFLFGGSSFSPDPEYNLLLCGKEKNIYCRPSKELALPLTELDWQEVARKTEAVSLEGTAAGLV